MDLAEAAYLFARDTQVSVRQGVVSDDRSDTVLMAKEFETLSTPAEVRSAGERLVDFLNGILFIDDPARRPISIAGVYERDFDGKWGLPILSASANIMLRGVKARALAAGQDTSSPAQSAWMAAGLNDDVVADVLSYLRGNPDWFDLYKAYEAMRRDAGTGSPGLNWPKNHSEFSRDAQLHRHSRQWCEAKKISPAGAMELREAQDFIRSMVRTWLDWKCSQEVEAKPST